MGLRIDKTVEIRGGACSQEYVSPEFNPDTEKTLSDVDFNEFKAVGVELDRMETRHLYGQEIKNQMALRKAALEKHVQILIGIVEKSPSFEAAQKTCADISAFRGAIEELNRWITGNF